VSYKQKQLRKFQSPMLVSLLLLGHFEEDWRRTD